MLLHPRRPLVADLVGLLIATGSIGVAAPCWAEPTVLTSSCADGSTLCWVEPGTLDEAAPEAAPAAEVGATATAAVATGAGVLSLSNADIGSTQLDLVARMEPETAAEDVAIPDASEAIEAEPWGAVAPAVDETWTSIDGDEPVVLGAAGEAPLDFTACMEKAIRGEVGFVPARRVCEILFPESTEPEVE